MNIKKLTLIFLFFILPSSVFASSNMTNTKADTDEIKNQLDGYLQQLSEGKKSTLLNKKDFYSVIYYIDSYEINSIDSKNGKYLARIVFHTKKRTYQNDSCPIASYDKEISEDIFEEIEFKKLSNNLKITKPLRSPYVLEEKGLRYILRSEELCGNSN